MPHDVFISYASNDKSVADAVCACLESHGLRCWYAPRDIAPGEDWGTAIVSAIAGCGVFVLVMTTQSNASKFVRREVERAVSAGKPILPLRMEDIQPSPALELFVSATHWLDALTPPLERHLELLATRVCALLQEPLESSDEPTGGAPLPGQPLRTPPKRQPRFALVATALLAVPALGIALWAINARTPRATTTRSQPTNAPQSSAAATDPDQGKLLTDTLADRRVLQKLYEQEMSVTFSDNPLEDVLTFVKRVTNLNMDVDWNSLSRIGVDRDALVSTELGDVTARGVLNRVLIQASPDPANRADWAIEDGILIIAARADLRRD